MPPLCNGHAVPSGATAGAILRVKARGVPHINDKGKRGDALVKLVIMMPKKLSRDAENLVKKLKEEGL